MKVLFMGTPPFAVASLKMLLEKHQVIAVVTQPDRPKGRGKKLIPPVVKEVANEYHIPVFQPEKVKEAQMVEKIKQLVPDVIVVVAFGQILPESILSIPKYGCINVHGSLLPQYRGAAPIQWAVINGEKVTGVTTMFMAKGLDSGDMILKQEIPLEEGETYGSLHDKMAPIGAKLLENTLELLEKGQVKRIPQVQEEATYAPMISKEIEQIDWSKSAEEILCLIHGLTPAPGAYSNLEEQTLKIWNASKIELSVENSLPGTIVKTTKKGFAVKTGTDCIFVEKLQAKGGKIMDTDAYMRGHEIKEGMIFS